MPVAAGTKAPCLHCVLSWLCLQLEGWELSFFNHLRILVFPPVPSLLFDKQELMPEARR